MIAAGIALGVLVPAWTAIVLAQPPRSRRRAIQRARVAMTAIAAIAAAAAACSGASAAAVVGVTTWVALTFIGEILAKDADRQVNAIDMACCAIDAALADRTAASTAQMQQQHMFESTLLAIEIDAQQRWGTNSGTSPKKTAQHPAL